MPRAAPGRSRRGPQARGAQLERLSRLTAVLTLCGAPVGGCSSEYIATVRLVPPVTLQAEPSALRDRWLLRGSTRMFEGRVERSDGGALSSVTAAASADWITTSVADADENGTRAFSVFVYAEMLTPGEHRAEVTLSIEDRSVPPARVEVSLLVWDLEELHVGLVEESCPHTTEGGGQTSTCDHHGVDALSLALAEVGEDGARILLYDNVDSDGDHRLAEYRGCFTLPAHTWISAAPSVDPRLVAIVCERPPDDHPGGALFLAGDSCRVHRLSLVNLEDSDVAISTARDPNALEQGTTGHLIENLFASAWAPEIIWQNGIGVPFVVGAETTIRNCRFYGYYNGGLDLSAAHGSRIVHNSFVFFQEPKAGILVSGSRDLTFANNVVVSLSRPRWPLLQASAETRGLTARGNAIEGYEAVVVGLEEGGLDNTAADNVLGPLDLESPYRPYFLADAPLSTGTALPGEGSSLDGVDIEGRRELLPGALQTRSDLSRPRRDAIRVGTTIDGCDGGPCDIDDRWPNEIQIAVWSAWPGAEVQLFPPEDPDDLYAGNAIISWGITLRGMTPQQGAEPSVVLRSEEEDEHASAWGLWARHESLLTVLDSVDADHPVNIENLVLQVDTTAQAGRTAVTVEGTGDRTPSSPHRLRRLRIEAVGAGAPAQALYLGDRVIVQDVLVHGPFGACIRYGPQHGATTPWPEEPTTSGWVVQLTCRLTGTANRSPRAGFEVDWAAGILFANVVAQLGPGGGAPAEVPLFRYDRAASTDSTATPVTAWNLTYQAVGPLCAGEHCEGAESFASAAVVHLPEGEPLFASDTNSHLDPDAINAAAIDGGLDYWTLDDALERGYSLDGVHRVGGSVDRGAFEQ